MKLDGKQNIVVEFDSTTWNSLLIYSHQIHIAYNAKSNHPQPFYGVIAKGGVRQRAKVARRGCRSF